MDAIELQHDLQESCHGCNCEQRNNQTSHDIDQLLTHAYADQRRKVRFWAWLNSDPEERAFLALHEARARILSIMDSEQLLARQPSLIRFGRASLGRDDPRILRAQQVFSQAQQRHDRRFGDHHGGLAQMLHNKSKARNDDATFQMTDWERAIITLMVRDAYAASDKRLAQTRELRNRILILTAVATCVLALVIAAAGVWGWKLTPTAAPSVDGKVATWTDTPPPAGTMAFLAVSLLGCVGGFLSGIRSVSRTAGTRNQFRLSWWQSWLKLPAGALTAIVGVFALQSRTFPAVPATGWAELLTWAVAFGAAQQAITRFIDKRVQDIVGEARQDDGNTSPTSTSDQPDDSGPEETT